jgi:hypothetical protein
MGETYSVEGSGVVIAVVDANLTTVDASVAADAEVVWHERVAVGLQKHVTLEEGTLGRSGVDLLGLTNHDRLVFQVVEDGDLPELMVLKTALDDVLFEVTVESQHLL